MDLLPLHQKHWQQFQQIISNQRLAQALLIVGGSNCGLESFTRRLMALHVCNHCSTEPCMQCQHCKLIQADEHPDIHWIKPEKAGGALKIEQIRNLQTQAYKTPQMANNQFFIIQSSEKMNKSVSNALLKILEEPSEYTHFILIAEHLSTLLPTIISRCQLWRFAYDAPQDDLLGILSSYPEDSGEGVINQSTALILENLIQLFNKESIPTLLAAQMKNHEFKDLLWLLSLIYSQLIRLQLQKKQATGTYSESMNKLLNLTRVEILFNQLTKITSIQRKISHNLNINQILALEDLFINIQNNL